MTLDLEYNDMRNYIDVVDSSAGQVCAYLEGHLGQGLYKILIDQWTDLTPRLAQWAWEQVMFYEPEDKAFTVDLYAKGLQYGITTAWQLKGLLELDINNRLPKNRFADIANRGTSDGEDDFFCLEEIIEMASSHLRL